MAKRKPAARSRRRPGRQAASAPPGAKNRVRRASSARPAGAATRKTAARAKAATGGTKARGVKAGAARAPGRRTSTAKAARVIRKSRPSAARPARSTRSAQSKLPKSVAGPKTRRPSAKFTKTATSAKPVTAAKVARPVKPATPVKTALTARPAAVKPPAPRKAVLAPAQPKKPTLTAFPPLDPSRRKRAPDLNRERRRVQDDDDVVSPTPPSSLGLDRTASAARSGRQELRDRYDNHNETGPALTAGDIDADWESAYSTGDEAPGGDNPTPDQNVVDDIGLAVGVAYDDNEELEGADKIVERDRHRWEFDPASSDDFDER